MNANIDPDRRARRWFWTLLGLAVAAMAALYTALGARSSPATGLAVAGAILLLLAATAQAARIRFALEMRSSPSSGPGYRSMPGTRTGPPALDRSPLDPPGIDSAGRKVEHVNKPLFTSHCDVSGEVAGARRGRQPGGEGVWET